MPIHTALKEVEWLIDRGFPNESPQWCDLRGIVRDLRLMHGYDPAVLILKLDGTSLFFLSFALAIYGLKINVQ